MTIFQLWDDKLLAGCQWLINLAQRSREWWVEQCATAILVTGALIWALRPFTGWGHLALALDTLIAAFVFSASRFPPMLAFFGSIGWRWRISFVLIFLGGIAIWLPRVIAHQSTVGVELLNDVQFIANLLAYYVAACEPPSPPKKREERELEFAT